MVTAIRQLLSHRVSIWKFHFKFYFIFKILVDHNPSQQWMAYQRLQKFPSKVPSSSISKAKDVLKQIQYLFAVYLLLQGHYLP